MLKSTNDGSHVNLGSKSILITGGSGFLGYYLAKACKALEAKIYGIDIVPPLDVSMWEVFQVSNIISPETQTLFVKHKFDIVFHLAGAASVVQSINSPVEDFQSLLPPTLHLLYLLNMYSPSAHMVAFSSAAVYGNPIKMPVEESFEKKPLSPYGIHKAIMEELINYYSTFFQLKSSVLRIFSAFGEGLRKQLFWDILNRYEKQSGTSAVVSLFGQGDESRDFIYAGDVARAAIFVSLRESNTLLEYFNVASGREVKISEAVEVLFSGSNDKPKIVFNGIHRQGDPKNWLADITKLKTLGFAPTYDLKQKLVDYYLWYMKNSTTL